MIFDGAHITWGGLKFPATTGPHGRGPLPPGRYRIAWRRVVPPGPSLPGGFTLGGFGFFLPLEPVDVPDLDGRGGFGVHPDGGVPGSLGCPVITTEESARAFWALVESGGQRDKFFDVLPIPDAAQAGVA